jgi:hypothetical protein
MALGQLIRRVLRQLLQTRSASRSNWTASGCAPDVTGLSCLADGADQIFARAVTDLGGKLEVIIPASEYRAGLPAAAPAAKSGQPDGRAGRVGRPAACQAWKPPSRSVASRRPIRRSEAAARVEA